MRRMFFIGTPVTLRNIPAALTKACVSILSVCGSLDPALEDNTRALQKRYQQSGGQIKVIIKEGAGHYPLAPEDPRPVVEFIAAKAM